MTARTAESRAREAIVARARAARVLDVVEARGVRLKRAGLERVGPCPVCGGRDRFSVNPRKNVFHCRGSGAGGDAIALVEYLDGCDFLEACARIAGERLPDRPSVAAPRRAPDPPQRTESPADDGRERAWAIWREGLPAAGTLVDAYFARRGLVRPAAAPLRFHPALPFWHGFGDRAPEVLWRGPAMLAAITRPDGQGQARFAALHCTWIDPERPDGKALILDPATGDRLPSKKVRGPKAGGRIALVDPADPVLLLIGEGIETVLSAHAALAAEPLPEGLAADRVAAWSAVDLGNLAGPAAHSVPHPFLWGEWRRRDGKVRRGPRRVPGPVPDVSADPARSVQLPPGLPAAILLGDGDSDRFTTEAALARAARRLARPGLRIAVRFAPEGQDFNDAWRGRLAHAA